MWSVASNRFRFQPHDWNDDAAEKNGGSDFFGSGTQTIHLGYVTAIQFIIVRHTSAMLGL